MAVMLPERMKKIQSKMKAQERYQHYPSILRRSKGANFIIGEVILTKFKLIQALIVALLICKNKEDALKIESLEWSQHFPHYKSIGIFQDAQGQLTHKSLVGSCRISNSSKL